MFLVDDILLFPLRGGLFVFREIQKSADAEKHDSRPIIQELQDLYMRLETKKISEEEFDKREAVLLERLEQTERSGQPG
ncbi:MAG: gas vesicle protein GvpG [Planctomycetota bacterium]